MKTFTPSVFYLLSDALYWAT